ncbi:hypothetical protein GCM10009693_15290 [Leucobacter chromiireducens subsp. chromiireducens]
MSSVSETDTTGLTVEFERSEERKRSGCLPVLSHLKWSPEAPAYEVAGVRGDSAGD